MAKLPKSDDLHPTFIWFQKPAPIRLDGGLFQFIDGYLENVTFS
jgi:hypothetical protein